MQTVVPRAAHTDLRGRAGGERVCVTTMEGERAESYSGILGKILHY